MNTDVRNGLGAMCLAAILGLLWAATWDLGASDARASVSGAALLFALIGLFLVMKGLFARSD